MNGKQHAKLGLSWGTAVMPVYFMMFGMSIVIFLFPVLGWVGGLLPDIDHNSSRVGSLRKRAVNYATLIAFLLLGLYFTPYRDSLPDWSYLFAGIMIIYFVIKKTGLITFLTRHRGLTHYVDIYLLASLASLFAFRYNIEILGILMAFWLGYGSHLAGDASTTEGARALILGKTQLKIGGFKEGTFGNKFMFNLLFILPYLIMILITIYTIYKGGL